MADGERDIIQMHTELPRESCEAVLRMEADAANEAAQIMYDALIAIAQLSTEEVVTNIANEAIDDVSRED